MSRSDDRKAGVLLRNLLTRGEVNCRTVHRGRPNQFFVVQQHGGRFRSQGTTILTALENMGAAIDGRD